jgi:hypothetical protein
MVTLPPCKFFSPVKCYCKYTVQYILFYQHNYRESFSLNRETSQSRWGGGLQYCTYCKPRGIVLVQTLKIPFARFINNLNIINKKTFKFPT